MLQHVTKIGIQNYNRLPHHKLNNSNQDTEAIYKEKINQIDEFLKASDKLKENEKPTFDYQLSGGNPNYSPEARLKEVSLYKILNSDKSEQK